ncbi:MAG TPA: hypothetical protein VKE22_15870 [Haliangiales bacterium]|nr:hypothetical protein [Haliangiales bacterium]
MPAERFKPMLFADQSLDELIATMSPPGGVLADARGLLLGGDAAGAEVALVAAMVANPDEIGTWHRLLLGASQLARGSRDAAIRTLRAIADGAAESRPRLWAWRALRDAGAPPDDPDVVLGAIVEVNTVEGIDTLAAYADGSARYLLHTGQRVLWDRPDGRLDEAIARVMSAARAAVPHVPPGRLAGDPGPQVARHTLLTAGGLRSIEEPMAEASVDASPRGPLFAALTDLLKQVLAIVKW